MRFFKNRWTDTVSKNNPLPEYPRPQFRRDDWMCLNGQFEYAIKNSSVEWANDYDGEILVPFAIESMLSGVERNLYPNDRLWYRKKFVLPNKMHDKRILLNFGAVDWQCKVFINKALVGTHSGGYCSFSFDITNYVNENENELVVCVYDPTDKGWQQRGKQVLKTHGFWYTATSGIWQSVWLESVNETYIEKIKLTPDIDNKILSIKTYTQNSNCSVKATIYDNDNIILKNVVSLDDKISFNEIKLWSPENPFLYDIKLELIENGETADTVYSYFGMRKYSLDKDEYGVTRFFLNNKPYFQKGLLDQGYWSDGGMTPPTDEAMIYDIQTAKNLGFNMLRKHIKIENDRWYYHCDKIGMLVWQDMVSGGEYIGTFLAGVLPILHIKVNDSNYKAFNRDNKKWRDDYKNELNEMLNQLYNHTSICCWVPFNEGWGQFDSAKIANSIKKFDSTRLVDHASGWYDHGAGDINSMHKYILPIRKPHLDDRIFAITEFGGYSRIVSDHTWNERKSFGYQMYKYKDDLTKNYKKLFENQIIPLIDKGLSATIYTQLTDVENEVNGIMTFDREHIKIDERTLIDINKKLKF